MPHRRVLILLLLLGLLLSACAPATSTPPLPAGLPDLTATWTASDLRLLDPSDCPDPADDLVAVYARRSLDQLQFRLDFLDLPPNSAHDLYLALSGAGSGAAGLPIQAQSAISWNTLLVFPASQEGYALDSSQARISGVSLAQDADPDLDIVYLRIDGLDPSALQSMQVFVVPAGSNQPADQSAAARLNGPAPQPANLLMAFWDTLPAPTPAQALRRWDGAHTGPLGQRHGLYRLLQASSAAGAPVALLDLKTPSSLTALDFLGQVDYVRDLQAQGLVILPEAAYGDPESAAHALQFSRTAGQSFDLADSPLAFGIPSVDNLPQEYQATFAVQPGDLHLTSAPGLRTIPLPPLYPTNENPLPPWWDGQIGMAGLSLDAKRALLDAALAQDPSRLVVLGGGLPKSAWGDSSAAPDAFRYLMAHPWIQTLSEQDLLSLPTLTPENDAAQPDRCLDLLCTPAILPVVPYTLTGQPVPSAINQIELRRHLRDQLASLPPGPLTHQAWLTYLQLTLSTADPYRQALQANYLGEVGHLLRLAQWAAVPQSLNDCSTDLDFDGQPECWLSNAQFAATFEPEGGRLVFAAALSDRGADLVVAPSSLSGVGWGDPQDWQISRGPASDPNEIPGAFVDSDSPFRSFQAEAQGGQITFTSADPFLQKSFSLTPQGLQVRFSGSLPSTVQIPLAFNPTLTDQPGWAGQYALAPGADSSSLRWQAGGASLTLETQSASLSSATFLASFDSIHRPEDPDYAYPPGHFLPFPFALVEAQPEGEPFTIRLTVASK